MCALSKVTVNKGSSGLGRRISLDDGISGIVFYNDTLPSGFLTTDRIKKVFSLDEAELLGIAEGSANHDAEHYHIAEFFRMDPAGSLYIGFFDEPAGAYDYTEVELMQTFAKGEISIFGVYAPGRVYIAAEITALQAVLTPLETRNEPAVAFLANDIQGTADLSTLVDARTVTAPDITVVVGEDNAGRGAAIAVTNSLSVTHLGALMGATASALVSQSVGNPENFNLAGAELTIPGYANGQAFRELTLTQSAAIKDKGLAILRDYQIGRASCRERV